MKLDCRPTAVGGSLSRHCAQVRHCASLENLLLGYTDEAKTELLKGLELDELVTEQTPPAFICSTSEDTCVPPINSLAFATELAKRNIKFELHVYPQGAHGMSACNEEICPPSGFLTKNGQWLEDCASFFRLFTAEKF